MVAPMGGGAILIRPSRARCRRRCGIGHTEANSDKSANHQATGAIGVIKLTRLNGQEFIVNAQFIKFLEKTPDTLVTLRDGDKFIVREEPEVVIRRMVEYQRSLRVLPGMD